jgi:ABC-type multidrug transport system permease subunit
LLHLANEFKLARTTIPIHLVVIFQPSIMYLLMTVILVHPTFDMYVIRPTTEQGQALVTAMTQVGSPIGDPYINPILITEVESAGRRQVVKVEIGAETPTAVQRFGLIDSNLVKNFRNRLTAAGFRLWDQALGKRRVNLDEYPWLPKDVPYKVYFGMAMLPMTLFMAATVLGGILTAQEFEFDTILEYRLSPVPIGIILGARLTRLTLTGIISASVLLVTSGVAYGVWPTQIWRVLLTILPMGIIAAGIGIIAGLAAQKTLPAFIVGLILSFVGWIIGSAFGLAAGFGGGYEFLSRLTPNTHAVELLFPSYFGVSVGNPLTSAMVLFFMSAGIVLLAGIVYRLRVKQQA